MRFGGLVEDENKDVLEIGSDESRGVGRVKVMTGWRVPSLTACVIGPCKVGAFIILTLRILRLFCCECRECFLCNILGSPWGTLLGFGLFNP